MATYIKTLHDADGNTIAPITLEEAVYDENAVSLTNKLAAMPTNLSMNAAIAAAIGDAMEESY